MERPLSTPAFFVVNFDEVPEFLRDRMKDAQETMARYANRTSTFTRRRPSIRSNGSYSYQLENRTTERRAGTGRGQDGGRRREGGEHVSVKDT